MGHHGKVNHRYEPNPGLDRDALHQSCGAEAAGVADMTGCSVTPMLHADRINALVEANCLRSSPRTSLELEVSTIVPRNFFFRFS
eukprot:1493578-Amphidinium_carterae.1